MAVSIRREADDAGGLDRLGHVLQNPPEGLRVRQVPLLEIGLGGLVVVAPLGDGSTPRFGVATATCRAGCRAT